MPTLSVALRSQRDLAGDTADHPKVSLRAENGLTVHFPSAPTNSPSNIAARIDEYERVGRPALVVPSGRSLPEWTSRVTLAGRNRDGKYDYRVDVEAELNALGRIAQNGLRCQWIGYGVSVMGWFRIKNLSYTDKQRQHGTNRITIAEIDMTLITASDAYISVGPVSNGAKNSSQATASPQVDSVTIREGGTWWQAAYEAYGDGSQWQRLADLNGVSDPNLTISGSFRT